MGTIRSQAMRGAAEGQQCMLNISGVCTYDSATTCMVHLPDETKGWATKSDDISSTVGCQACHDVIDGRRKHEISEEDRQFYMRRGMVRWYRYLFGNGVFAIKGAKAA